MATNRTDFRRDGNRTYQVSNGRCVFLIIGLVVLVPLLSNVALGQFTVTPMKLDMTGRPGRTVRAVFELQNTTPSVTHTVDLDVVDVYESEDGQWMIVGPDSNIDTSKLASCKDWIKLDRRTYEVGPLRIVPVMVTLRVPPGVRGFSSGGITATMRPREGVEGVAVSIQFLVPIYFQTEGRAQRHQVELYDLGMAAKPAAGGQPATTEVWMRIANRGGTYSRLRSIVRVSGLWKEHWREVTMTPLTEVGIIPGADLRLTADIGRSLPPAKYKISGAIYVDGRRAKSMETEMDFAGDPTILRLATDAALDLEPKEVLIKTVPGAVRTSTVGVYNASDGEVDVQAALVLPEHLGSVATGELRGKDLGCAEWVQVIPERFRLRAGARQNLRLVARMPNPTSMYPNYYANLVLQAVYPDGQSAGKTVANIAVDNTKVQADPIAQAARLDIAAMGDSKYHIAATFGNHGKVHFAPTCRAVLTMDPGTPMARTDLAMAKEGMMLPLEFRDFSSILDFSGLPAGAYRVTAVMEYGPSLQAFKQIPLRVSVEEDQRIVEVFKPAEGEGDVVGIEW
ncbi:MAG: hypothetical protein JSU70_01090 [Phycisphaerales bacterium]|nr:MAG: hypothetical protein JSU70_01090 [Phycisphaerales bacterium]